MDVPRGAEVGPGSVGDGAVERYVDHERRVTPFVARHLRRDLRPDDFRPEQPEYELGGVDTGGHQAPSGDLLATPEADPGGSVATHQDLVYCHVRSDRAAVRLEIGGQGAGDVVHAALYEIVPRVLQYGREQPGDLRPPRVVGPMAHEGGESAEQALDLLGLEVLITPGAQALQAETVRVQP